MGSLIKPDGSPAAPSTAKSYTLGSLSQPFDGTPADWLMRNSGKMTGDTVAIFIATCEQFAIYHAHMNSQADKIELLEKQRELDRKQTRELMSQLADMRNLIAGLPGAPLK